MITPQNKGLEWLETLNDGMHLLTVLTLILTLFSFVYSRLEPRQEFPSSFQFEVSLISSLFYYLKHLISTYLANKLKDFRKVFLN